MTFKQERPKFCEHKDCEFKRRIVNKICGGKLPKVLLHDGDSNTHRFCINFAKGALSLRVNKSDLDWFRWIFDALDGKKTSSLSFKGSKTK